MATTLFYAGKEQQIPRPPSTRPVELFQQRTSLPPWTLIPTKESPSVASLRHSVTFTPLEHPQQQQHPQVEEHQEFNYELRNRDEQQLNSVISS